MSDNGQIFVVFARKKHEEPLVEVGTVNAGDAEQARQEALNAFPDGGWLEMIAVPRHVVVSVVEAN
jgi:hypothetical protein